jgi:hypothetical protein
MAHARQPRQDSGLRVGWLYGFARGGYHESRRCSRDTYPESYITKNLVYEDSGDAAGKAGGQVWFSKLHKRVEGLGVGTWCSILYKRVSGLGVRGQGLVLDAGAEVSTLYKRILDILQRGS